VNNYMKDLWSAFYKIDKYFFFTEAINQRRQDVIQFPEQNLTSELIRHFRNNMETRQPDYKYLRFDFDLLKAAIGVRPDFVLHSSPRNRLNQLIFGEVKLKNRGLFRDIDKLYTAINNLKFEDAVMIVVNPELRYTLRTIRNYKRRIGIIEFPKNLWLFHAIYQENTDEIIHRYYRFSEI